MFNVLPQWLRATARTSFSLILLSLSIGRVWAGEPATSTTAENRLVTGKHITPQGSHVGVGSFPANMLLSPDGKYVVVTNTGFRQFLSVVRVSDGHLVSQVRLGTPEGARSKQGLYYGLAFARDGEKNTILYASRGAEGTIASYRLDANGQLAATGKMLTIPKQPNICVAGVAVAGKKVFAVNNDTHPEQKQKGTFAIFDLATSTTTTHVTLPGFPFEIAAITAGPNAGQKLYISSERDGGIAVVDAFSGKVVKRISTGAQTTAVLLDKSQRRLFVANSGSDTVSIIDTRTDEVIDTILLRVNEARDLCGATPLGMALSPDERTLYVALADMNAVAVVQLGKGPSTARAFGLIPTGWYPTAVAVAPNGKQLFVSCAKGVQARTPNDKPLGPNALWGQYPPRILEGTVSRISLPGTKQLQSWTDQVIANNRLKPNADASQGVYPLANPGIKHVVYIIKENRTYDQVLGDLTQGNGDKSLCMFPRAVTPNQHALAERFVLLDNFYDCAEVSADGWNWSTSGMVSEYTIRNAPYSYSGRGRNYDYEGQTNRVPADMIGLNDVAAAPCGYIWDLCVAHKVAFRNYGFFVADTNPNVKITEVTNAGAVSGATENTHPTKRALADSTDSDYRGFDLTYADSEALQKLAITFPKQRLTFGAHQSTSRFSEWKREFDQYVRDGNLPPLQMLRLGNDHTRGTTAGAPAPRALVADNDYAVGQFVEAISNSPYWDSTAIFIIEDDAQNGFDHVDAHRSTAYVISPFIKKGTVDHRFYNTDSVLRTMECLLNLPPMNQYDAVAPPIDVFEGKPANNDPWKAILPDKAILSEVNKPNAYKAEVSAALDFSREDAVPDELLNDILWHALMGKQTPQAPIRHGYALSSVVRRGEADED